MLPDWVSNPGPLTYESGALPIALRGPAPILNEILSEILTMEKSDFLKIYNSFSNNFYSLLIIML